MTINKNDYKISMRTVGIRYARMSEPPKSREPIPINEFYEPMVECKKMKARVRESYCGMHPCCKGCGREFSNAFK